MKQHITVEQLNELSPEAKERLREWWKPKSSCSAHSQSPQKQFSHQCFES